MHNKNTFTKILPNNDHQLKAFLHSPPKYKYYDNQLINEYRTSTLHHKIQIIEFFNNSAFLNLMIKKNCNKFIIYIANQITTIAPGLISKTIMLNILINEIMPILKEQDVFDIISKSNLLNLLSEEQIISLFKFINIKNNCEAYYYICSFEKIAKDENGSNYILFTGKTLYLKKLCNSYLDNDLYNYIVLYFIKLSVKEWDIVVSEAKAGTFCAIPQYQQFLVSQKTSSEIIQITNFIVELSNKQNFDQNVHQHIIKRILQRAGFPVIAHCSFRLLHIMLKSKNVYIIKSIFDIIFNSPNLNVNSRARSVILNRFEYIPYGELFFLMVDHLYPQDLQKYIGSKMLSGNKLNYDTQLRILYILLLEQLYYRIDQLDIMRSLSNNLNFMEHKLYIIASIQGISKFLPAIIDYLIPTVNPQELYRVMVELYNIHSTIVNDSAYIYSSMIILYSFLGDYPLYLDDAKNILITCFDRDQLNVMGALFCYIIDYNIDYNDNNIPILSLFNDLLQYCNDDLKATIIAFAFKKFWQEEQYAKCSIILQRPFMPHNIQLLYKLMYYIPTLSGVNEYKQLLDSIGKEYINFSMNALHLFQYNTILDLKSDSMILTLAYFPNANMLQQWCAGFNSYNHKGYHKGGLHFEKLALNPALAIFIHSFLVTTRYKFNDILTIKSYYCATEIPEFNSDILIQVAQYIKNNQENIIDSASKALTIFPEYFPNDLKDWTTVIWGIICYEKNNVERQSSLTQEII